MASVRFGLDCTELSWIASGCIGWVRFEFDSIGLVMWGWPASASFELDRAGWIAFSWIALVKLEMGRDESTPFGSRRGDCLSGVLDMHTHTHMH